MRPGRWLGFAVVRVPTGERRGGVVEGGCIKILKTTGVMEMNARRKRWIEARQKELETTKEPVLIKPDTHGRAVWWIPGQPKPDLGQMERRVAVAAEIEAGRTPRGGFTRAQTAKWGVPW